MNLSAGMSDIPWADLPWLGILITIGTLVFGGGGAVSWYKVWSDRKLGVKQGENEEDKLESERWRSIIQAQTESLIEPLRAGLADAHGRIRELQKEVSDVQKNLTHRTQMYWLSVNHIRQLYSWIKKHVPEEAAESLPKPPEDLGKDI